MIDQTIKWEDVVDIRKGLNVSVFRILYEEHKQSLDFPTLTMKVVSKDVDINNYKNIESDIIKDVFNEMIKSAESIGNVKELDGNDIHMELVNASNLLSIRNRRGYGNLLIISENLYNEYKQDLSVSNMFKLFITPYIKDKIIVAYKGVGIGDSGLVLNFFKGKYQIVDVKGSGNYYYVLKRRVKK